MFTGIIQTTAKIIDIRDIGNKEVDLLSTYTIKLPKKFTEGLELGASVSNNGCCLSVTAINGIDKDYDAVSFDLINTTLSITNLGQLKIDDYINIERSFKINSEVGGHILSGHIYDTVSIIDINKTENNYCIEFIVDDKWKKYIVDKGFIALDGMSLTISSITDNGFTVNLIPDTLKRTTIGTKKLGDRLNLELDNNTVLVVDSVERIMKLKGVIK